MAYILIVEDNYDVAPLEIALSFFENVSVVVVADGRHALHLVESRLDQITAVVTDLHLPFVDGFDLVAAIRLSDPERRVPIIVVSGDHDPDIGRRVRDLGADAFFPKPYSPAEVRLTLKGLIHAS